MTECPNSEKRPPLPRAGEVAGTREHCRIPECPCGDRRRAEIIAKMELVSRGPDHDLVSSFVRTWTGS